MHNSIPGMSCQLVDMLGTPKPALGWTTSILSHCQRQRREGGAGRVGQKEVRKVLPEEPDSQPHLQHGPLINELVLLLGVDLHPVPLLHHLPHFCVEKLPLVAKGITPLVTQPIQ